MLGDMRIRSAHAAGAWTGARKFGACFGKFALASAQRKRRKIGVHCEEGARWLTV